MTTARLLVDEAKRHLLSGQREPMNQLNGALTSSQTTVTFLHPTGLPSAGSYVEVDLEMLYVWSITGQTATVQRGMLGSVAASHSDRAVATVNPKYPDFAVFKALNDDLRDLSSPLHGLYAVRSVELSATANSWGYNLPTSELLEVISVESRHVGNPRTWMPVTNFRLQQNAETDDFASGTALHVMDGVRPGQPIRVLYKSAFGLLTSLTDDVETVTGLPTSAIDIPPLGAAMVLVAPREIRRNSSETQGDTRRAGEVPPGAVTSSMRGIAIRRAERISHEAAKLSQRFPERGFTPVGPMVW